MESVTLFSLYIVLGVAIKPNQLQLTDLQVQCFYIDCRHLQDGFLKLREPGFSREVLVREGSWYATALFPTNFKNDIPN